MSTRCRSGSLALTPRATWLPTLESSGDAGTQSSRQPAPLLSGGSPSSAPGGTAQGAHPHGARARARATRQEPARGHAHPAPSGTAPRTGARPFQTVLPASSVDTRKTWGLGPAHQAPFGKHVAAPCPARSQTITEVKVSRG